MVERGSDVGGAQRADRVVLVLPLDDRALSGCEVELDLLGRRGGKVGVHAGADGGEDPVELHRKAGERSPCGSDLGRLLRAGAVGGEDGGDGGVAVAGIGELVQPGVDGVKDPLLADSRRLRMRRVGVVRALRVAAVVRLVLERGAVHRTAARGAADKPGEHVLALRSPKSESQFVERGALTIEHVLPQSWHANWPFDVTEDDTPEGATLRRDRLLHSIGNLTLVTGSLNTPMSNNGWDFKRGELAKHSVLHLNKRILEMNVETWDEATIADRARELAERAIEIWPR